YLGAVFVMSIPDSPDPADKPPEPPWWFRSSIDNRLNPNLQSFSGMLAAIEPEHALAEQERRLAQAWLALGDQREAPALLDDMIRWHQQLLEEHGLDCPFLPETRTIPVKRDKQKYSVFLVGQRLPLEAQAFCPRQPTWYDHDDDLEGQDPEASLADLLS